MNIPLVFINTPLTDEYLDSYRTNAETAFLQFMLQLSATESGFIFRDLGQIWPQRYDYFSDPSHLNRYGAYQVSNRIAQDPMIPWPQAEIEIRRRSAPIHDPAFHYLRLISPQRGGALLGSGNRSLRIPLLAIASIVFYTSLQLKYLPLILALVLVNFIWGCNSSSYPWTGAPPTSSGRWRKRAGTAAAPGSWAGHWPQCAAAGGVQICGYLAALAAARRLDPGDPDTGELAGWLAIALPLGLSFFTFECIAYLVDVYRGAPAPKNLAEFTAYKLFFPKADFRPHHPLPRLYPPTQRQRPTLDWNWVVEGLWLIARGSVKKLLIADHIAVLVNLSFDNLERAGSGDLSGWPSLPTVCSSISTSAATWILPGAAPC
jgi:hypothetical protein